MMLGLGAWLAIRLARFRRTHLGINASRRRSCLGAALADDQAAGPVAVVLQHTLAARRSLVRLLSETPEEPERTPLPKPQARLTVENLYLAPPGARRAGGDAACWFRKSEPGNRAIGIVGTVGLGASAPLVPGADGKRLPAPGGCHCVYEGGTG